MSFDEDMKLANRLAKQICISGTYAESQQRIKGQEKIRRTVIRLWNAGDSCEDIAKEIKRSVKYVRNYLDLFAVIYGEDAVRERRLTFQLPQA